MIESFTLKAGSASGQPSASVQCTPITIFVGPNNSGKSRLLSEMKNFCSMPGGDFPKLLLEDMKFKEWGPAEVDRLMESAIAKLGPGEFVSEGNVMVGHGGSGVFQVTRDTLYKAISQPNHQRFNYVYYFLNMRSLLLDGQGRMTLTNQQPSGDLQQRPNGTLQRLFRDDKKRSELRRMIYDAFKFYFVIDPTAMSFLRVRFSARPPVDEREERGIDQTAVDFHSAATPVELCSDGVKAFTGILMEVMAGDPSVIFMDEPEAFLHPSLSYKLGVELSKAAAGSEKNVFVSTHSSSFIMGCIQSGVPVNVVRLTYQSQVATARVLSSCEVLELMRNPLLRSAGVLEGLFYENVVVTESDTDRAFYQEINYRLVSSGDKRGIPNCLFLNAQNKQTVPVILSPLRKLGVAAAGVVDIDTLKDGGKVWTSMLERINYPSMLIDTSSQQRTAIKSALQSTGKDMKRDGGVLILQGQDREAVRLFLDGLAGYGYFVVSGGEVECWLKQLCVKGHGTEWLIKMFETMGEDPSLEGYVKPDEGDVWDFMGFIKEWLFDANRKGLVA